VYAITGATGHTGSQVVHLLLEQKHQVRAFGRSPERLQPLVEAGAEPIVGEMTDPSALRKLFSGARAAYVMIPPTMGTDDFRAFQNQVAETVTDALRQEGVGHVVVLSSVGADKTSGTGPVVGLHGLEQRLAAVQGLNALCLRPGYFMENLLSQAQIIQSMGATAGPVAPDVKLPLIATHDIGVAAGQALLGLHFTGFSTRELLGERDLSMTEAAHIIGQAIGRPDLGYTQLPPDQVRAALTGMGMSANMADLILEMADALNSGHMRPLEERSEHNTTPTPLEQFVQDEFLPLMHRAQK
jgi:uncharacterized protein YbjT (DUF2867 family)